MTGSFGFSNLSLRRWRQFESIDIDLHPRLTVFTGANGSGKSTLLSILEGNLIGGIKDHYLATPLNEEASDGSAFSFGTLFSRFKLNPFAKSPIAVQSDPNQIGKIQFENDSSVLISLPSAKNIQYQLQFSQPAKTEGFKIGSHRPVPKYQLVQDIPVSGISPKAAFNYFRDSWNDYEVGQSVRRGSTFITNPISPLKQSLIAFALQGSSNQDVTAVREVEGLFRQFQSTLKDILPREINFKKLDVRPPEIVVMTETGDFPIDGASGGLMSIIQTSWQIFLHSKAVDGKSVVVIDEPENHLHPSLQREFLTRLVEGFPDVQFIVATHSPFIVCSVRDSFVYALRHRPIKEQSVNLSNATAVVSERIDFSSRVGTASKILDEVLGVPVTMPIWVEEELSRIVGRFEKEKTDKVAMAQLRKDLKDADMSEFLPQAISKLLS